PGNTPRPAESCGMTGFAANGYLTNNTYDALDNLIQSVQGSQTRTSTYDGLNRITSATIIEGNSWGTINYAYNADNLRSSVTDPRGAVTFEYDELHRPTRKKYNGTVIASYNYDGTQANNAIGRLITERDGDFASAADKTEYTYDPMGRGLSANRTISGTS